MHTVMTTWPGRRLRLQLLRLLLRPAAGITELGARRPWPAPTTMRDRPGPVRRVRHLHRALPGARHRERTAAVGGRPGPLHRLRPVRHRLPQMGRRISFRCRRPDRAPAAGLPRLGRRTPQEQNAVRAPCAALLVTSASVTLRPSVGRPEAAGVSRLRLGGHRRHRQTARCACSAPWASSATWKAALRLAARRRHRHRPHPLGHPRPAVRGQRPPPHATAAATSSSSTTASSRTTWRSRQDLLGRGPPLRLADRHRGDPPPDRRRPQAAGDGAAPSTRPSAAPWPPSRAPTPSSS